MGIPLRDLSGTSLRISALGFGCVRLTTCRNEKIAQRTLTAALESGVTHFDTARLYGSGHSERILGNFLQGRRDRVTVATKLGLTPAAGISNRRLVISAAKKLLAPFPGLLAKAKRSATAGARAGQFDVPSARQSLTTSLATLRTDYLDLLLLHEATLADASSEPLQKFLDDQVRAGVIRALGIGSAFERFGGDAAQVPEIFRVLQFESTVLQPNLERLAHRENRMTIIHGVFNPIDTLISAGNARPEIRRRCSDDIGLDLGDRHVIGSLLLHSAMQSNPDGVVLFSSTSPERIAANAVDLDQALYSESQLQRFGAYARSVAE